MLYLGCACCRNVPLCLKSWSVTAFQSHALRLPIHARDCKGEGQDAKEDHPDAKDDLQHDP